MPSVAQIIRRRRNRKQRQRHANTRSQWWSALVFGGTALAILGPIFSVLGFAGFLYVRAITFMPSPADTIYLDPIVASTNLYDRTGTNLLYSVQDPLGDDRQWVTIESLPDSVIDATIQMEDPDYLAVGGVNISRTISRLWRYGLGQPISLDTSLAGRLATTTLVPAASNSGLDPVLLHLVFASEVQRQYTPRRVLEWYLNTTFYGNDAYGIDAAAQVYFGKRATDLTLDEAAMLAAIPLAPEFNPLNNEQATRDRQLNLLREMRSFSLISPSEFDTVASILTPIRTDLAQPPFVAAEFSLFAREQAEAILNQMGMDGPRLVSRGGLQITTTLDLELYYQAECTLWAHLNQLYGRDRNDVLTVAAQPCIGTSYLDSVLNVNARALPDTGSLVVLDVQSAEIRALVGDATSYDKQPGPTLYPFIYLSGFLTGNYTPASMLLDIPTQFPGPTEGSIYTPVNPDGEYNGPLNLRDAMAAQLRVPAISVANREGLSRLFNIARTMGLNNLNDLNRYDLSLIDRGGNVSLLDITYANSVFASLGRLQGIDLPPIARDHRARNPVAILRIEDPNGTVLWTYDDNAITNSNNIIVEDEFAFLINDILADSGTRQTVLELSTEALSIGRPVAVSNGLTGDVSDSWTIGYTPQLVVGVHLDRLDDASMSLDFYNLQGSAPIWQAISRYAHERYNYQPAIWPRPDGIVQAEVCGISGLLPPQGSDCPRRVEIFHPQVRPIQEDLYWQSIEVNSQTGQRASSFTPEFLIIEQQYFIPPASALEWWETNNLPLPPSDFDESSVPDVLSEIQIFAPNELETVRGVVDVRGRVATNNLQSYQVRYGAGIRPTEWVVIGETQTSTTEDTSLGQWDTSGLNGPYVVQISVVTQDGAVDSAGVRVTVDNEAPTVTLNAGDNNQLLYRWPQEPVIALEAQASDNLEIDRVEFYNNGVRIGEVTQAPYEWIFTIDRVGIEVFTATVFDTAGNQASDDIEVEVIRDGAGASTP